MSLQLRSSYSHLVCSIRALPLETTASFGLKNRLSDFQHVRGEVALETIAKMSC